MPRDGRPMTLHVMIPGDHDLVLERHEPDVNATVSDRGEPIIAAAGEGAQNRCAPIWPLEL